MRRKIGFLLFTVILVSGGLFAPAALGTDDSEVTAISDSKLVPFG